MQDFPLTIASIMRHACGIHGARTATTATGDGYRHISYREIGQQAAQLANALRRIGVTGDQRVGTFMWNNAEHLTAYLAVPSMGAVLHTLNIRLFPDQIAYVASEADDRVVVADASLAELFAPILSKLDTVHTVIAVGEGDLSALQESGKTVLRYAEVLGGESTEFDWPQIDERSAAAMCYTSGTTGHPKGVVYSHRSSYLHTMAACSGNAMGLGSSDSVLPIVPMFHANAWGMAYAALAAGADLVLPDCHLDPASVIDMIETQRPTVAGAVPTIWNDVMHRLEKDPGPRHLVAAAGDLRRLGRSSVIDAHLRGTPRRPHPPAVGHDRDVATGHHGVATARNPGRTSNGRSAAPRDDPCAAWRPGSSPTTAGHCRPMARPSVRWRFAAPGSPARTTADATRPSSRPGGCAPATSAASTSTASSR